MATDVSAAMSFRVTTEERRKTPVHTIAWGILDRFAEGGMPFVCTRWIRVALLFPELKDGRALAQLGLRLFDYIEFGRRDD